MIIPTLRRSLAFVAVFQFTLLASNARAADAPPTTRPAETPAHMLGDILRKWADIVEPLPGQPARALKTKIVLAAADGLPAEAQHAAIDLSYQAPDRLRIAATIAHDKYAAGRNGQKLWLYSPGKHFAILGTPDVPRFRQFPNEKDDRTAPLFALPVSRLKLALVPLMVNSTIEPPIEINGVKCEALKIIPKQATAMLLGLENPEIALWVRESDRLPVRIALRDAKQLKVQLEFAETSLGDPLPDRTWELSTKADDKVERVASGHLLRFLDVLPKLGHPTIPTLGPETGQRRVVATEGAGRLEEIDGTKVLFLKGSPEEMGRQHGTLLAPQVRDVCNRILYGIGVGSSIPKGHWFFGEVEDAQARLEPFIDPRHLKEMDALAQAAGVHVQESRLANFFPELFHCTGFAIFGKATKDGRMYHGRVLDYLRGVGLEQNAVVIVHQPNYGHAWINLGYAGFIGSVTAMNERGISIGEMGGGGEGHWDGKPMAELIREVMEQAGTLDEAVAIMQKGPRTCEYYYVIADGNAKTAVGIAATPTTFEVIHPGEIHPRLRHPLEDTVMLSAGDRYEHLVKRVKDGYGTFDEQSAIALMTRPVCMTSNIQSVLFAPDTLDLWVANADAQNVASATRFTHYNLKELLNSETAKTQAAAGDCR